MKISNLIGCTLLAWLSLTGGSRAISDDDHWWGGFGDWQTPAPNATVEALVDYEGDLIAGGWFWYVDGHCGRGAVARWDGVAWHTLGNGIGHDCSVPGYYTVVFALAAYKGDLIAAGRFQFINGWIGGSRANNIARWDGTTWYPMGLGLEGGTGTAYALAVYGDDLFVSGNFTLAGGQPTDYVARWNGSAWEPVFGFSGPVSSFTTYDGKLIAAGGFTRAGGHPAPHIASYDGVEWRPFGPREIDYASDLVVCRDTLIANAYYRDVYEWLLVSKWDGNDWVPLTGEVGPEGYVGDVYSLAVYNDQLFAGGFLASEFHHIARWDGSNWMALGSGVGYATGSFSLVSALVAHEGHLYVGGRFDTAGGKPSWYIARWDDVITPVSIEELTASQEGGGIRLTWRLSREAMQELEDIHVERAEDWAGPYGELTPEALQPDLEMAFTDTAIDPGRRYWYRLRLVQRDGSLSIAGPVEGQPSLESPLVLLYPPVDVSPDRPIAIRYRLDGQPTPVRVEIFTPTGRLLRVLDRRTAGPGEHLLSWDRRSENGAPAARGVYLVRLSTDLGQAARKLVLLHR